MKYVIAVILGLAVCPASVSYGQDDRVESYADLVDSFDDMKINFQNNEEASTLLFQTKRKNFEGVMVVKWDDRNGVMHLIQTMPLRIEKEKFSRFLLVAQKLNHGFLFPGLGINLDNGGTYYRLSIPVSPRGYILRKELETYTRFSINKAAEFLPTIKKAMNEEIAIDELIPLHQKHLREMAAKPKSTIKLSGKFKRNAMDSEWELDFSKEGQVTLKRDGEKNVVSKITIEGTEYSFEDQEGTLKAAGIGTYQVALDGDQLTFRLKEDASKNSASLLTGGKWTAVD